MSGCVSRWFLSRIFLWMLWSAVLLCTFHGFSVVLQAQQLEIPNSQSPTERQIPERVPANTVSLQGVVRDQQGRVLPRVALELRKGELRYTTVTDAEGIFRLREIELGAYELTLTRTEFATLLILEVNLNQAGPKNLELQMRALTQGGAETKGPSGMPGTQRTPVRPSSPAAAYPGSRSPSPDSTRLELGAARPLPPSSANFAPNPDRWDVTIPEWERYAQQRDVPYVKGHWYDPFNLADVAHPCTQGSQPASAHQNGVVFFPGSLPLYKNGVLVGGLGVSGDGVDQDDYVTNAGAQDFAAPAAIRADQAVIDNVRLPYLKFPRNPTD